MDKWQDDYLGDLVSFEYGSALGAESRDRSGFPVYGSNGVVGRHGTALVAGPGIVIGRKGSAGALQWSEGDFWPIDTTYWVKPRVKLDLRWIREALGRARLESLVSSTGVPGLNRDDAYERLIPVPPLEEQRRIAEILDTIDETIQATERVIAKRRQLRNGMISDWIEHASIGLPSVRLASIMSTFVDGDWIETPFITNKGIRLIQTGNIGVGAYLDKPESQRFISPATFDLLHCSEVRVGDLLICRLADPVGRACIAPPDVGDAITAVDCTIARVHRSKADTSFLRHLMSTPRWLGLCERLAAGTTRKRISRLNLGSIAVSLPSIDEQRRIAAIIDGADVVIARAGRRINEAYVDPRGSCRRSAVRTRSDGGRVTSGPEWERVERPLLEHLASLGWATLVLVRAAALPQRGPVVGPRCARRAAAPCSVAEDQLWSGRRIRGWTMLGSTRRLRNCGHRRRGPGCSKPIGGRPVCCSTGPRSPGSTGGVAVGIGLSTSSTGTIPRRMTSLRCRSFLWRRRGGRRTFGRMWCCS